MCKYWFEWVNLHILKEDILIRSKITFQGTIDSMEMRWRTQNGKKGVLLLLGIAFHKVSGSTFSYAYQKQLAKTKKFFQTAICPKTGGRNQTKVLQKLICEQFHTKNRAENFQGYNLRKTKHTALHTRLISKSIQVWILKYPNNKTRSTIFL